MKNVLLSFICLFALQMYGQQKMKTNNNNTSKANEQIVSNRIITNTVKCPFKRVKISVAKNDYPDGHDDGKRYISVEGTRKTFYSGGDHITSAVAPGMGLPTENNDIISNNYHDGYGDSSGYLRIKYIANENPSKPYCNENGYSIKNSEIYKVTIGNSHQEYNGSLTVFAASNLDSNGYTALTTYYNMHNSAQNVDIPQTCPSNNCISDDGDTDDPRPDIGNTTWVDVSGKEHDWTDDDDGFNNGNPNDGGKGVTVEEVRKRSKITNPKSKGNGKNNPENQALESNDNPLYVADGNTGENVLAGLTTGNDSIPQPNEAQDHNSSRSNKPSPIRQPNRSGNDSIPQPNEAQDHNSSRSNKPSPIRKPDRGGNDSIPQPNEAQDHNSSRSNKPSPIRKPDRGGNDSIFTSTFVEIGGIFYGFENDTDNQGYVHQSYGVHVGIYVPIIPKATISFGVNIAGDYLRASKDGFKQEPAGFKVNQLTSTINRNGDEAIAQSIIVVGAGPQINFSLTHKLSLSAIVQGGITAFKQDGFAYTQEFQEGDATLPVEIFNQEETKSTKFFWIPRLRLSYTITSKIAIWAEGNYMMGKVEAKQSRLNPGAPKGENGAYYFGQINSAEQVEKTVENDLKGAGVAVGISFKL